MTNPPRPESGGRRESVCEADSWTGLLGWSGYAVHVFTGLGAGCGFMALATASELRFGECFGWLGAALFIDGADGALARRLHIDKTAAVIDGVLLDLVVDYLTYVVAPLYAFWRAQDEHSAGALFCSIVACVASALYFADRRMKTTDNWFRGFPACWNVAALYYFVFRPPFAIAAICLIGGAAMMFAPITSAHPLRSVKFRPVTVLMTVLWLASAAMAISRNFAPDFIAQAGLAASAFYFMGLSFLRGPISEASSRRA